MQDIPVSGRIHIAVMLTDTPEDLESIVAVGYGSQYKEQITSAITQVKVGFSIYLCIHPKSDQKARNPLS